MNDSIKMFIADEEVVSNNDFTINEEMLSASSTILNNCYPKSWELTKDYVSNFYYPKDYSRFVLAQGEYEHGNQEFAPLFTSGKNIIDISNYFEAYTSGNNGEIIYISGARSYWVKVEPNKTYTFSRDKGNRLMILGGNSEPKIGDHLTVMVDDGNSTATSKTFVNGNFTYIVIYSSRDEANRASWIMLEEGNQATTYEPYNQPNLSYETNVEKEWDTFNVYGRTYQATRSGKNLYKLPDSTSINGITYTKNNDGTFNISGTASADTEIYTTLSLANSKLVYGNTYTFSINNLGGAKYYVHSSNGASWVKTQFYLTTTTTQTRTFDTSTATDVKFVIRIDNGATVNGTNLKIQLEAGSTATSWEPYGVSPSPDYPSELVSAGYQNIFIGKDTYDETINSVDFAIKGTVLTINGSSSSSSQTNIQKAAFITPYAVKPNTVYTYKVFVLSGSVSGTRFAMNLRASATTSGTGIQFNTGNSLELINGTSGATFTSASNANYLTGLQFIFSADINFNNLVLGIQLEEANQAHSYIAYGKYGIEITNTGKNIFNIGNFGTIVNSDMTISSNNNSSIIVNGTATATRNFWFNNIAMDLEAGTYYFSLSDTDNNMTYFLRQNGTNIVSTKINTSFTINQKTHIDQILIQITSGLSWNNKTINIQLERGSQTTYEPYTSNTQLYVLDEPLRQIGSYKDKLYTDGRVLYVKREVGNIILKGTETWYHFSVSQGHLFRVNDIIPGVIQNNTIVPMCNYYHAISYSNQPNRTNNDIYISLGGQIDILNNNYSNATDFKTWLSTHNTEVNYVLQTPTITPLGYIDLPSSYEGQNNVSIYTGLDTRTELWYYWKNYDVLFAGVVKNSGDISLNPRHPHYCSLQILDYKTFLSESNTLDFVIANKTISEAIEMVVNAVSGYGFVVGNIDIDSANDIIGAYSTLNKTAYDVLQYLAEISGSRWRARVIDSLTMAIDFYDPDTLPEAEDIEYTKEYWEANNIVDMTFNYGSRDYRNKQILLSNEVYGNINYEETLISNGYGDTFTVQNNIGVLLNVIVDGAEKTIATINDKQMGIDADFYYTPGKNIIESNGVYSAGTMIRATYQPLVKGRQIVYNASEVERISNQTQTEGVIARYENRNDILSSEELQKIAQTYIDYKGKPEVIIKITTQDNDLYDIGEVVYFNAPIDDLKQNYMVKAKNIEYIIIDKIIHLFYVYELTSSFNSEKAINYFDNQRNKASGNIAEGESITRNIDIETEVGIIWTDGSVSSTAITVDGDNILNSVLNSPFVE